MSGIIVIGSQWGDEGKGKLIDVFSSQVDCVVRYQGGANAGHTLNVAGRKTVLHLIPSGILHSHVLCLITAGVALDIFELIEEIEQLKKSGYLKKPSQLLVSESATLLLDYHKQLDQAREQNLGEQKIGTTGKGIGPAYEDRSSRKALLFGDLFLDDPQLEEKLKKTSEEKLFLLSQYYKKQTLPLSSLMDKLKKARAILEPHRCSDTSLIIHQQLAENKKVLFEGAQGVLLDLWHGSYPYVTSSSTLAGAAFTGSGISWKPIKKVLAVAKAYTTRVGQGPFPSECDEKHQKHLEEKGQERGATTNRRRRCGWLDLVALKYAVRINGASHLALMKLDVLSGLKTIKVCTAYKIHEKTIDKYPIHKLDQCQPVYEELEGWSEDLSSCRSLKQLPQATQKLIRFIEERLGLPVNIVSVGPERESTIWIHPLF